MATITKGKTFGATESVTNEKLHTLVDSATITGIVNADVSAGANIDASKLNLTGSGFLTTGANFTITGSYIFETIDIDAGTIDGAVIGANTPAAIIGTTLKADTSLELAAGAIVTEIENNDSLGTSDTKLCTQGNVKAYADSIAIKAWVVFAVNGTMADNYNVDGVVNNSTGVYTITWGTNFANTNYCVVTGEKSDGGVFVQITTKATGTLVVYVRDRNGALTAGVTEINIMAIGDQ